MTHPRNGLDISFDRPATYRIIVKGRIDQLWFEDLGEMDIRIQDQADEPAKTILSGRVRDQAELMGIMNSLYELHMTVLSVEHMAVDWTEKKEFQKFQRSRKYRIDLNPSTQDAEP
jgi:hypothetical protein